MKHFLLDTNVLLDLLMDRKPFSGAAAKLFDYSEKEIIRLYLTAVSYNNSYYILKKLTSHKDAIITLRNVEAIVETIDTSRGAIKQALDSDFNDFEDAIQYYTGRTNKKLDAIVTRNVKDFKLSEIPILTPGEAVSLIKST